MLESAAAGLSWRERLIWLAALLEGEGSFGSGGRGTAPGIRLNMTDLDVMERAASELSVRVHAQKLKPQRKQAWVCGITGTRAAGWMMMLYPFLHQRRRERIRTVLAAWRAKRPKDRLHLRVHLASSFAEGAVCPRCDRRLTFDSFSRSKPYGYNRSRNRHAHCRECRPGLRQEYAAKRQQALL